MTEGLHPQHTVPSRMAWRCIGVSTNPSVFAANWSSRRSTIEFRAVDRRTEDYLWFVSGIPKVIQSIILNLFLLSTLLTSNVISKRWIFMNLYICECCFWETLDTKDQQIWWASGGLSLMHAHRQLAHPLLFWPQLHGKKWDEQLNNEYVKWARNWDWNSQIPTRTDRQNAFLYVRMLQQIDRSWVQDIP